MDKELRIIHDDINLIMFVIPGLTPYQVRGRLRNPVFSWIPAPRLLPAGTSFAGMTAFAGIKVAGHKRRKRGVIKTRERPRERRRKDGPSGLCGIRKVTKRHRRNPSPSERGKAVMETIGGGIGEMDPAIFRPSCVFYQTPRSQPWSQESSGHYRRRGCPPSCPCRRRRPRPWLAPLPQRA